MRVFGREAVEIIPPLAVMLGQVAPIAAFHGNRIERGR
jgi:hypothetical protein